MNLYEVQYEYQPKKVKGTGLIEAENVLEAEKAFLKRFEEDGENQTLTNYHIKRKEIKGNE